MDGCSIFREDLAIKYPDHGHALWEPDPDGLYDAVEVGDVGFIRSGYFHRLFNALRPPDTPSNPGSQTPRGLKYPPQLQPRNPHHIRKGRDNHQTFFSDNVTKRSQDIYASGPDDATVTFVCSGKHGALLYLPFLADREETTARADFSKWIIKNVDDCFKVAEDLGFGVNRIEDIVLVTGRHLARSWASAAFSSSRGGAEVSFQIQVSEGSGIHFVERDVTGGELKLGPTGENLPENQCIFVQGYRVTRILNIWPRIRAAASAPDMHEPEPESDMRFEPLGIPSEADYPDPLHILLEYIAEQASDSDMILVHDNDLGFIGGALHSDTLMERIRNHGPAIRQIRCELGNKSKSGAGAEITTVATLSQDLFEAPRETHNTLEPGTVRVVGINPQTPLRGSSPPSPPHGIKRKLSSSGRNTPTPSGDDIDMQFIGPGVPLSMSLESPGLKRRGSIVKTQRVGQANIFDRRHSIDAHTTPGEPQWQSGHLDDLSSSMSPSSPVSSIYGYPAYSANSSHGHPSGTDPFPWHSRWSPDQPSTVLSEADGSISGRPFDPSAVPPLPVVPPVSFSAERRGMSIPTYLSSSVSANPTVPLAMRSRPRPLSSGVHHNQNAAGPESGGPASASSSAASPSSTPNVADLILELKSGYRHENLSRELDELRHELESICSGDPPFESGGPHPSMDAPCLPDVVPYSPRTPLPTYQSPQVPDHQTAPPHSDSHPGSSQNIVNASSTPPSGSSGSNPEAAPTKV